MTDSIHSNESAFLWPWLTLTIYLTVWVWANHYKRNREFGLIYFPKFHDTFHVSKNLIKTCYYYIRSKSLITPYSTQRNPPVFPHVQRLCVTLRDFVWLCVTPRLCLTLRHAKSHKVAVRCTRTSEKCYRIVQRLCVIFGPFFTWF